jgi:hypothetical protein
MDRPTRFETPAVAVLSGGNIDPILLMNVLRHGMATTGRYLSFRVRIPDRPGGLARLLADLADATELARLIDICVGEEFTVVAVPAGIELQHFTDSAPSVPASSRRVPLRRKLLDLLPTNREYRVEYQVEIPRSVDSYHVTFEVPDQIYVRRLILSTDADLVAATSLAKDLRSLADEDLELDARVYELEVRDALWRVSVLARRRIAELLHYRSYLRSFYAAFGDEVVFREPPRLAPGEVLRHLRDNGYPVSE